MTVDVTAVGGVDAWPFDSEEIVVRVQLLSWPVLTNELITDPSLVLHRFGGTYGPVRYLLSAGVSPQAGSLSLALSNEAGVPFHVVRLPVEVNAGSEPAEPADEVTLRPGDATAPGETRAPVLGLDRRPALPHQARPLVHVAHAADDDAWAEWISWQLAKMGYDARLKVWGYPPGEAWGTLLRRHAEAFDHMLVLLSPHAVRLGDLEAEWNAALQAGSGGFGRRFVLVRVGAHEKPEVADVGWIDLMDLAEEEAGAALRAAMAVSSSPSEVEAAEMGTLRDEHRPAVFVSYTDADRPWAEWIAWQLVDAGHHVQIRTWHESADRSFPQWIGQAALHGDYPILVLSRHFVNSAYSAPEWQAAFAEYPIGTARKVVPVQIEECDTPGPLAELDRIYLADLPEDAARSRLVLAMQELEHATKVPRPPRFPGRGGSTGAPRYPRDDQGTVDAAFLESVMSACADRYPEARIKYFPAQGSAPSYIDIELVSGGTLRRWPVGVASGELSRSLYDSFLNNVHRRYERRDPTVESELVCAEVSDSALLRAARRTGLRIYELIEYQRLWNPRRYLARQAERLATDPVYPAELYVPQRFVLIDDPSDTTYRDALVAMMDWLDSDAARLVLVLADFGHGKTFLLRQLARAVPTTSPNLVPMLIDLGALEKSHSLDVLLGQHLIASGEESIDIGAIRRMLERGQLLLLFDGFDELALRVTYDRAAEHLSSVLSAVSGRAKVVLSSRTQHFASDGQWRTALGEQVHHVSGSRLVRLLDFDDAQIQDFLGRLYGGDRNAAEQRLQLIHGIRDLLGLAHNPRMLSFIAALDEHELRAARAESGEISSAALYEMLLNRWLWFEVDRRHPAHSGVPGLSISQIRRAVTALALRLWQVQDSGVDVDQLEETTQEALTDLTGRGLRPAEAAYEVGSGSLLVRDGQGTFRFVHSSVMEYLVAAEMADHLASGEADSGLLAFREMSSLMADFLLSGSAGSDAVLKWAQATLANPEATSAAVTNALTVIQRLGISFRRAQLTGRDLRGQDLSGSRLEFAELSGADLRDVRLQTVNLLGARLERADLRGARLLDTNLARASLVGARLAGTTLEAVQLVSANLTGTDLRNTRLRDVQLRRAHFWGSRWTAETLAEMRAAQNRPPGGFGWHEAVASQLFDDSWFVVSSTDEQGLGFSPGRREVVAQEGSGIRIRDLDGSSPFAGEAGPIRAVAFSPDSSLLATADDTAIHVWDVAGNVRKVHTLFGDGGPVRSMAFAPDGRLLASADSSGVRVWDVSYGGSILVDESGPQYDVAFSPDGSRLAKAGNTGVHLMDLARTTTRISSVTSRAVAFSPDGGLIATAGEAGIGVWGISHTARPLFTSAERSGLHSTVAFSPDGRYLTSVDDEHVRIWDAATYETAASSSTGPTRHVIFSSDGRVLASIDELTIRIWYGRVGAIVRR